MKASQFNILTEDPQSGKAVLFNSLYGGITILEKAECLVVKRLLKNSETSTEDSLTEIVVSQLQDGRYIIEDDVDEIAIVRNRKILGMKDKNRLDVVIMPNMTCNFACPYCFESHIPKSFMNNATEEAIKRFLKNEIPKYKVLMLNWFGGEPLMSYRRIISIGKYAKEICDRLGVGFLTNITTNGSLFNARRVKELVSIGITNYQITVDGPPEIHNKTRVLKNGEESFWRIYENILMLARTDERVKISLRVNFNHNNIHSIPELLKLFPEDIRPSLRVVYEPIFGKSCLSAADNIASQEISSTMTQYYRLAKEMGFDVVLGSIGTGKLVYCFAERKNQCVINYNGDVFKCSVCSFKPEERVGYLDSDGRIVLNKKQWGKWFEVGEFEEKCYLCKFLPLCMGGCRKARIENKNTGSRCSLIPANTSYVLKAVAFDEFDSLLQSQYVKNERVLQW